MKNTKIHAFNVIRQLLRNVPGPQIESGDDEQNIDRDYGMDELVKFAHSGKHYSLVVEVKSDGAPRFVRSGVYRHESCVARMRRSGETNRDRSLVPMIATPYLSPASRAICLDHEIANLDLVGNA